MYELRIDGQVVHEFDDYTLLTIVEKETKRKVVRLIKEDDDDTSVGSFAAFNQAGQVVRGSQVNVGRRGSTVQVASGSNVAQASGTGAVAQTNIGGNVDTGGGILNLGVISTGGGDYSGRDGD